MGNDPAYGFGGTSAGTSYRYYSLPSQGLLVNGRRQSVKVAVVPVLLSDGDSDNLRYQQESAKDMRIEVMQDVLFSKNLAASEHWQDGLEISPRGSLFEYFRENSNGKLLLEGKVFSFDGLSLSNGTSVNGWYKPNQTYENMGEDDDNVIDAVEKAVAELNSSALASVLADYDNPDTWKANEAQDNYSTGIPTSSTAYFDCVIALCINPASNDLVGAPGWNIKQNFSIQIDGKPLRDIAAISIGSSNDGTFFQFSTLAHELGHAMGLPDTYDRYDETSSPMNYNGSFTQNESYWDIYDDVPAEFNLDDILEENSAKYINSNRYIAHYNAYEKVLLGWIDQVVEVFPSDPPGSTVLPSVYDSTVLVLHQNESSAPGIYNGWQLFTGPNDGKPDEKFLLVENRGYRFGPISAFNLDSSDNPIPALDASGNLIEYIIKFDGLFNPDAKVAENDTRAGGLAAFWVDTSRAGETWVGLSDGLNFLDSTRKCNSIWS